jgi:ABC-type uncharacterized transport system involved in gliding motility auxiliary subunit
MVAEHSRRSTRYQGPLFIAQVTGAAVGCLLLLFLAGQHNVRIDLTPKRVHTLTNASREVVARLDQNVTVTVFYSRQDVAGRRAIADLLERYDAASRRIHVRLRDLDRSPGLAKQLGVSRYGTGVLEGKRRISLGVVDEERITGALMQLVDPVERTVYFTVAHGEHDPLDRHERRGYSQIAQTLDAENYTVRRLEQLGTIPADAAVVMVAAPRIDFSPVELSTLRRYVATGGAVLFLLDPGTPPGLTAFLTEYGLLLSNDIVIDERNTLLGADSFMPRIPYVNQSVFSHPPELPAVLPEAQSIVLDDRRPGIVRDYLASSAEETWADADRDSLTHEVPRFERGQDHRGPVPVAALARVDGEPPTGGGSIIVIGDADFVTNLYVGLVGNRDLFLALVDLLTHRELHGVLRPLRPGGSLSSLSLTAGESSAVFWTTVVGPPALVAAAGLLAAVRRRRRLR